MERKLNFVHRWLLNSYGMPFHESNTGHHRFSIIFQLILLSKDRRLRISRADVYIILHLRFKNTFIKVQKFKSK